jgi:hypothetical protein
VYDTASMEEKKNNEDKKRKKKEETYRIVVRYEVF